MTQHAFQFGTQVRDRLMEITQTEFSALSTTERRALLLDSGQAPIAPTWHDVTDHQNAVYLTRFHPAGQVRRGGSGRIVFT